MDTITLKVPMPKGTFLTLGLSEKEAVEATKRSFIAEEGVPYFDYTNKELEEEVQSSLKVWA